MKRKDGDVEKAPEVSASTQMKVRSSFTSSKNYNEIRRIKSVTWSTATRVLRNGVPFKTRPPVHPHPPQMVFSYIYMSVPQKGDYIFGLESVSAVNNSPSYLSQVQNMGDTSKLLKIKSDGKDWCQKDEHKLELRLGPPGEEFSSFSDKPVSLHVSHKRVAPAPVVGWPPIRSFRKNMSHGISAKTSTEAFTDLAKQELPTSKNPKSGLFVKINMDGVPIGRKIDLAAYSSYEKLSSAIDDLFRDLLAAQRRDAGEKTKMGDNESAGRPILSTDQREEYTLVYEDNEGDRMLVGDVPWHMFVSAATRLRVMRTSELRTLSLGSMKHGKEVN